jgi:hypothetical protein
MERVSALLNVIRHALKGKHQEIGEVQPETVPTARTKDEFLPFNGVLTMTLAKSALF